MAPSRRRRFEVVVMVRWWTWLGDMSELVVVGVARRWLRKRVWVCV